MAVANACSDLEEVAKMHGSINDVCSNACSQAVIANFDVCNGMADMTSQMHPAESLHLTEQLEAIVTGCTAWKNGGHYDLDAITGGTR